MEPETIATPAGDLELAPAAPTDLRGIARYWPMELVGSPDTSAGAIAKASREVSLPMITAIGIDLRPQLALGGLAMHFAIVGTDVLVIKYPLTEDEPVWEYVVNAGFSRLLYAPMQPAALEGPAPPQTPRV